MARLCGLPRKVEGGNHSVLFLLSRWAFVPQETHSSQIRPGHFATSSGVVVFFIFLPQRQSPARRRDGASITCFRGVSPISRSRSYSVMTGELPSALACLRDRARSMRRFILVIFSRFLVIRVLQAITSPSSPECRRKLDLCDHRRFLSRYLIALASNAGSSRKRPRPMLQLLHRRPR